MYSAKSLAQDLTALGVPRGGLLVVHSGFRSLEPVDGGPAAVVEALREAVGPEGTLLMPTFTTQLIDPATWPVPPSPEERERLMAQMQLYDPAKSPPHKMGAVATALWRTPGARRSLHPITSWTAIGPLAEALTADHPREDPEGRHGPVGRAWERDARVLLLGVDHDANTTIHLAESLLDMPHLYALPDCYPERAADGAIVWRPVTKTTKCSDGFVGIGPRLEAAGAVRRGQVGQAPCMLLRSREIVRVAVELLLREPEALLCGDAECVHCPTSRQLLRAWKRPAPPALFD